MNRLHTIRKRTPQSRVAFTLTEMLVATALVILIMLMFAQIYGSAVGSITEQRGLANNDQKARILVSNLRSDLKRMTFRQAAYPYGDTVGIVPLAAGDEKLIDPLNQRGYFYVSENDVRNITDDTIQFTMEYGTGQRLDANADRGKLSFSGKASSIGGAGANQPHRDDGDTSGQLGTSRFAEVAYFLRNGNLYRRSQLLRDPLSNANRSSPQPTSGAGNNIFGSSNADYGDTYYNDFDYSAGRPLGYLYFNSYESLSNNQGFRNVPIALPTLRYGFSPFSGAPWEYLPGGGGAYLGRFTLEETSSENFTYPGRDRPADPMSSYYTGMPPLAYEADKVNVYRRLPSSSLPFNGSSYDSDNGVITLYEDGIRSGGDILMSGVLSMDIQVWDTKAQGFRDLGYALTRTDPAFPGDYDHLQNQNKTYGVRISLNGADGDPGESGVDDDVNTPPNPDDTPEQGWPATDDFISRVYDTWHPDASVGQGVAPFRPLLTSTGLQWSNGVAANVGDVVLPLAGEDLNVNGSLDTGEDVNSNGQLDFPGSAPTASLRAIALTSGTTGAKEPEWPLTPGATVQDGSVTWQIQDNRTGLRAIKITIRYTDQRSNLPRQVTLVHSFVE